MALEPPASPAASSTLHKRRSHRSGAEDVEDPHHFPQGCGLHRIDRMARIHHFTVNGLAFPFLLLA
jgi:hypothetical protein